MSSLDRALAELAEWRKKQIGARLKELSAKLSLIIHYMRRIQAQAQAVLLRPDDDSDPLELKTKYLSDLREIDEYIYVATEFKLNLELLINEPNLNAVLPDTTTSAIPLQLTPVDSNLQDIFSNPRPSTSTSQPINYNISNINQGQAAQINENTELPGQLTIITEQLQDMQIHDIPSVSNMPLGLLLPAGCTLEIDRVYNVYLINAKELNVWVIIDDQDEMCYKYYDSASQQYLPVWTKCTPIELLHTVTYCAAFVEETSCWARCLMLDPHISETHAHVYLMDACEHALVPKHTILPHQENFLMLPRLTNVCRLAGINSLDQSPTALAAITNFILQFRGRKCVLKVAKRSLGTVSCYLRLADNMTTTINHMLVENDLAFHTEGQCTCISVREKYMIPQAAIATETLAPTNEAVGQDARVSRTRRTLFPSHSSYGGVSKSDDLELLLQGPKIPPPVLPAPGATVHVVITHVVDLKTFYVQIIEPRRSPQPKVFGQILPPETLDDLESTMNSKALISTLRRLESPPKPGDIVAAYYPPEEWYFRARVVERDAMDSIIVQYIDYGNEEGVPETKIFELDPRFAHLPCKSILCTLPEVDSRNTLPDNMTRMKNLLWKTTRNKAMTARVISHSSEQLQISLFYPDGRNVAKIMAGTLVVRFQPWDSDANDTTLTADTISSAPWSVL